MSDRLMLVVPTKDRVDRQLTLDGLSSKWLKRTIVVCHPGEAAYLQRRYPMLASVASFRADNIAHKRAWILAHSLSTKMLMLDDDLEFCGRVETDECWAGYSRAPGNPSGILWDAITRTRPQLAKLDRLQPLDPRLDLMFTKIERMLDVFAHGGISQRYMNHTKGHEFICNTKATHALAFHVPTVVEHCQLRRVDMFEDLDYTIQLLLAGFENAVYQWGCTNDPNGFNAPGGVSSERVQGDIDKGADRIAALYPDIVRTVERKSPDASTKGGKRIVVAWRKAAEQGKREWGNRYGQAVSKRR